MNHARKRLPRHWLWIGGAASACALAACASESAKKPEPVTVLQPRDFVNPDAKSEPIVARSGPSETARNSAGNGQRASSDVVLLVGPPAREFSQAAAPVETVAGMPERRLLVDQMVGQINGRPIYANEFFAPMDARLRSEASRLPRREWLVSAKRDIDAALFDRLRDELLLAEFEATLTPEQQQGILAFIESIREDLVSESLGAESLASQRFLETEGMTLDQKVDDITKARFVLEQLRRAIGSRVQVSYREVQQYYEQHFEEFNPKPVAVYRVLRIPGNEPVSIAVVSQLLAQGVPFPEIVEHESSFNREEGGIRRVVLEEGTTDSVELFAFDELNDPARKLSVGDTTERIEFRDGHWWIFLESIERPPVKSFYEAQLEIEQRLLSQRQAEEQQKYFAQLIARGSFSDIKAMANRLLEFAAERYLIQSRLVPEEAAESDTVDAR